MSARPHAGAPAAPLARTFTRSRHAPRLSMAAVLLVATAVLCFSIVDGLIKGLSSRYPILVLAWGRWGVQAGAMLLLLGPTMGWDLLRTAHPLIHVVRGALLFGSSLLFLSALRLLPLADATALNYSTPAVVVVLAAVFLHERLTRPRIAFVIAGAIGMALIVRPGAGIFQGGAALALGAAACYAIFQILTRRLAGDDARVLLFYPAAIGTVILTALMPWRLLPATVPWSHVMLIVGAGLVATLGHFLLILAFQRAPASAVTPFTYMHLVWATLVGWIGFGDLPAPVTVLGMAIIAGSGLLLTWHERRDRRLDPPEPLAVD